jgi:hypothetical protein
LWRPSTAAPKNEASWSCDDEVIGIFEIGHPIATKLLRARHGRPTRSLPIQAVQLNHEAVPWLMARSVPPRVRRPNPPLAFGRCETCLPLCDFERPERFRADQKRRRGSSPSSWQRFSNCCNLRRTSLKSHGHCNAKQADEFSQDRAAQVQQRLCIAVLECPLGGAGTTSPVCAWPRNLARKV